MDKNSRGYIAYILAIVVEGLIWALGYYLIRLLKASPLVIIGLIVLWLVVVHAGLAAMFFYYRGWRSRRRN